MSMMIFGKQLLILFRLESEVLVIILFLKIKSWQWLLLHWWYDKFRLSKICPVKMHSGKWY